MITDNTTENDLLAETIEELGQSLTELQHGELKYYEKVKKL